MKSIYVLRHSARDGGETHLNAAGVRLARDFGAQLGPMTLVLTSPAQRCIETVVALGCAVQEETDELALPDDDDLMFELDRVHDFADALHMVRHGRHVPAYARKLRIFAEQAAARLLDHQDALLVTHGGIVEVLTVALTGDPAAARLGSGIGFCDGVRFLMKSKMDPRENDSLATSQWTVQRLCS
jgi:broad specificity phosphatase PhoE